MCSCVKRTDSDVAPTNRIGELFIFGGTSMSIPSCLQEKRVGGTGEDDKPASAVSEGTRHSQQATGKGL